MCFGDSNTHGANSELLGERQEWGVRWTSLLQIGLGFEDYRIIEDGIGGRTTVFKSPFTDVACGKDGLLYSIATHRPIDMIIICLGTNDTQVPFNSPVLSIVQGYESLITIIKNDCFQRNWEMPKILVLSPPFIGNTNFCPYPGYDKSSEKKMRMLIPELEKLACDNGYLYYQSSLVASTGSDNLHITCDSHVKLANALIPIVRDAFI